MQVLFSRKGLDFCDEKPTSKQSSCSCSVMYFMMSSTALLTVIRFRAASRRNCSVTRRCCCKFVITMSITAVYAQQKRENLRANFITENKRGEKKYTTKLKATWMSDMLEPYFRRLQNWASTIRFLFFVTKSCSLTLFLSAFPSLFLSFFENLILFLSLLRANPSRQPRT